MHRSATQKALEAAFETTRKQGNSLALILFSIDRFRLINSRFGYRGADAVLQKVGAVGRATLGALGKLGRWNGDEFLCILPNCDTDGARAVAERLRSRLEAVILPAEDTVINITASFGIACYPHDGNLLRFLLTAADEALHQAKRLGRNRIAAAADLEVHVFKLGSMLEAALREERVVPAYQPIADLKTGEIVAEEALARIVMADGEVVPAEQFVDVASEFQLTHRIDRMIVLSTFDRCAAQDRERPLTRFINISGDLLRHPVLLAELVRTIKGHVGPDGDSRIKPLVIEVTERELLTNLDAARGILAPFVELGLKLALDDFGSGYSSFQYLADLPVSFLKIDGRLIQRVAEPKVQAIVRGIQNIASELKLVTLAEYIETEAQAQLLRDIGIDWGQGYLYGRARLNEEEARLRRSLSVNWSQGYYSRKG